MTGKRDATKQSPKSIEESIRLLARKYADRLKIAIAERLEEMKADDRSHFLIYQVLGVSNKEGQLVDEYQNKGRFLYKYAGSFLEEAAKLLFSGKIPGIRVGLDSEYTRTTPEEI